MPDSSTRSTIPGIGLHDELEILVRYGLTPQQALAASVVNGPAFLGKAADFGAIAAGKVADVLLLDGNPLDDIRATRAIHGVVLGGRTTIAPRSMHCWRRPWRAPRPRRRFRDT